MDKTDKSASEAGHVEYSAAEGRLVVIPPRDRPQSPVPPFEEVKVGDAEVDDLDEGVRREMREMSVVALTAKLWEIVDAAYKARKDAIDAANVCDWEAAGDAFDESAGLTDLCGEVCVELSRREEEAALGIVGKRKHP